MTRHRTITRKVATDHGSLYAHIELDVAGHVCGISFSTPGKHDNTAVDDLIRRLGEAANETIREIGQEAAARKAGG